MTQRIAPADQGRQRVHYPDCNLAQLTSPRLSSVYPRALFRNVSEKSFPPEALFLPPLFLYILELYLALFLFVLLLAPEKFENLVAENGKRRPQGNQYACHRLDDVCHRGRVNIRMHRKSEQCIKATEKIDK